MSAVVHRVGDSWSGRVAHEGHTITAIEWWPGRVDYVMPDGTSMWSSGRVRCTCGMEWNTSISPPEFVHWKAEPGKALCGRDGDSLALPGDLLAGATADVTCPACIEWIHA